MIAQWADAYNTAWYGAPSPMVEDRLESLREALVTANRPADTMTTTVGIIARDPDADPRLQAILVQDLPAAITAHEKLGVEHLIVSPEPMTPRSAERIAQARHMRG